MGINILLLLAGWVLFQQAKSDLTARAAQLPVLSEVKALQKSVAALLEQIKTECGQTTAQLDARCVAARDLIEAIDRRLEEARQTPARGARKRETAAAAVRSERPDPQVSARTEAEAVVATARTPDPRREQVYLMTDEGVATSEIARRTGLSEGEIELILGLRPRVT